MTVSERDLGLVTTQSDPIEDVRNALFSVFDGFVSFPLLEDEDAKGDDGCGLLAAVVDDRWRVRDEVLSRVG